MTARPTPVAVHGHEDIVGELRAADEGGDALDLVRVAHAEGEPFGVADVELALGPLQDDQAPCSRAPGRCPRRGRTAAAS